MLKSIYHLLGVTSLIISTVPNESDWPKNLDDMIYSDLNELPENWINYAPKLDRWHVSQVDPLLVHENSCRSWNSQVSPQQNSTNTIDAAEQFGFPRAERTFVRSAVIERELKSHFQYLVRIFKALQSLKNGLMKTLSLAGEKFDDAVDFTIKTIATGIGGLLQHTGETLVNIVTDLSCDDDDEKKDEKNEEEK